MDKNSLIKNKNLMSIISSVFIVLSLFLISFLGFYNTINLAFKDYFYRTYEKSINVSDDIVIIWIDDKSQSELWRFPFDRSVYPKLIENLNKSWASVIWLDITFPDKTNLKSDVIFKNSIEKAWNIVLWSYLDPLDKELRSPYSLFADTAFNSWLLNPPVDIDSQKVYFIWPKNIFLDKVVEPFSIATLKAHYAKSYNDDQILSPWKFDSSWNYYKLFDNKLWKDIVIPLSKPSSNEFLFSYAKPNKFTYISFLDAYHWKLPNLKDKIVLVWPTSEWLQDTFYSPVWRMYWVYIHWNVINSIITNTYFVNIATHIEIVLLFLLIFLSVYINLHINWVKLLLSNFVIIAIFLLIFYLSFINFIIPELPFLFILWAILSILSSNVIRYFIEDYNKNKLLKALSEYVSKDIAKNILSWNWNINLDWEKKEVVVMFSDLAWFTSISEKLPPEELVSFLREYLTEVSNVIMDNKWYIDKYEWDAVMALWWAFGVTRDVDNIDNCLQSVLKQIDKISILNDSLLSRWLPKLSVRFWINFWDAILWNIWSTWRKVEFTALWDNVNLASRLESINKIYWTKVCVSESVEALLHDKYLFRYLDLVRVKWKEIPVKIYELIWEKNNIDDYMINLLDDYKLWIEYYLNKDFESAKQIFIKLSSVWDWPSKEYLNRCNEFLSSDKEIHNSDLINNMLSK